MADSRDLSSDILNLPIQDAKVFIFDVDHTITRRSTGVRMATIGFATKAVPLSLIIRFPFYFLRYRFGNFTVESMPKQIDPFIGVPKKDLETWGHTTFDRHIETDIYPAALAFVRRLVSEGKRVILATSSFDFVIRPLADFLGITDVVATEVEFDEKDICTGMIHGVPAFSHGKVQKTREFLVDHHLELKDAAFFSDSINDLPLMELVGYPIPTNADGRLQKVSRARGWNTISFKKF